MNVKLAAIKQNPNKPTTEIYDLAKQTYKQTGNPVVIDRNDILSDVRRNGRNYKNVALPVHLARDRPFSEWNEQQFK